MPIANFNVHPPYLRCQVFVNPPQFGFFTAIFCHNSLFVELVSQVAIFIEEQRAATTARVNLS